MLLADMPLSRLWMIKKKSPQTNNSGTAHLKNLCPWRRLMYDNQKLGEMVERVISRMFCPSFSKLVWHHWSAVQQGCSPSLSACDKSDIAAEALLHFLSPGSVGRMTALTTLHKYHFILFFPCIHLWFTTKDHIYITYYNAFITLYEYTSKQMCIHVNFDAVI